MTCCNWKPNPIRLLLILLSIFGASDEVTAWSHGQPTNRRQALVSGLMGGGTVASFLVTTDPANAFANKISNKYDDRPKRRGPAPKDLGVTERMSLEGDSYLGLRNCGAAPNCFCSTMRDDPDHQIPAFFYPKEVTSQKEAFDQLKTVIEAYPPGQQGVDGGGFEIKSFEPEKGYMYIQFEVGS